MIKELEHQCLRCSHNWLARKIEHPVQCPKCKSPYWNKERKIHQTKKGTALKILLGLMILLFIFLFSSNMVYASGFASSYLPDGIFTITQGETKSYYIYLQNIGDIPEYVKVEITEGFGVVINRTTWEDTYTVPPHTVSDQFPVNINIKVPRNSTIGQEFNVAYHISTLPDPNITRTENIVISAPSFPKKFTVKVIPKEKPPINWKYVLLFVAIILIIIYYSGKSKTIKSLISQFKKDKYH